MQPLISSLEHALEHVNQNYPLALPVEGVYELIATQKETIHHQLPYSHSSQMLFATAKDAIEYYDIQDNDFKNLIKTLSPGPITYHLQESDQTFSIPSNPGISSILKKLQSPVVSVPILYQSFPVTSLQRIPQTMSVLDIQDSLSGIKNTVITSSSTGIQITSPGVIPANEIQNIAPDARINYGENKNLEFAKNIFATSTDTDFQTNELLCVCGTKEALKKSFDLPFLDYFHIKQHQNFILVNLGSQSSPRTILKNLYKNFAQIQELGFSKNVLLWQNWGKNHMGNLLEYTLRQYVNMDRLVQNQPSYSFQQASKNLHLLDLNPKAQY
jgi:tRNA A37 threonylcarbamoyladenosine synthetase subunit TsaC/SUA5/YrdC